MNDKPNVESVKPSQQTIQKNVKEGDLKHEAGKRRSSSNHSKTRKDVGKTRISVVNPSVSTADSPVNVKTDVTDGNDAISSMENTKIVASMPEDLREESCGRKYAENESELISFTNGKGTQQMRTIVRTSSFRGNFDQLKSSFGFSQFSTAIWCKHQTSPNSTRKETFARRKS